jgi:glycosyltransferase involved in cell wall biosynthesis
MYKISIIIPVYNIAPYLRRCLDCVVNQTLQHIEIICINDASTDASSTILHEYATNDNRITLINFFCNKGVSAARNAGIAIARGEYLGFIDGDDAIDLNFYERLYTKASAIGSYIAKSSLQWIEADGKIRKLPDNSIIREDKLEFKNFFFTGIYKTKFIRDNGIFFPLGILNGEDVAFLIKAVSIVQYIETVDDVIYYYMRRHGSAYTEIFTINKLKSVIKALEDIIHFLNSHLHTINDNDYARICARYILMCCWLFRQTELKNRELAAVYSANATIQLYKMCIHKKAIAEHLIANNRFLAEWIIAGISTPLLEYLTQKTALTHHKQFICTELRSRIMNKH